VSGREVAWRVFAGEYNDSTLRQQSVEEFAPAYVITPLGAKINRLYVVGVITDVENIGTDAEPMWRARISDPTGVFYLYAGQYQPEASQAIAKLTFPAFAAVVGKSRTYETDDGSMYVSIRPEAIREVDAETRDRWTLEGVKGLKRRLEAMEEAQKMEFPSVEELGKLGYGKRLAEGIISALEHYGPVELDRYREMMVEALKYLLPEYGASEEVQPAVQVAEAPPAPPESKPGPTVKEDDGNEEHEDAVLAILDELDKDVEGAVWEDILDAAKAKGLSKDDLEEAVNSLSNKGLIYEPVLGRVKKI